MITTNLVNAAFELLDACACNRDTDYFIGQLKFYVDCYSDVISNSPERPLFSPTSLLATADFNLAICTLNAISTLLKLTEEDLSDLKGDFIASRQLQ